MPQFKTMVDIYQEMIGRNADKNIEINVLNENMNLLGRYEDEVGLQVFVTTDDLKADENYMQILASDYSSTKKLQMLKELMTDIAANKLRAKLIELESEGIKITINGFNADNIKLFDTTLEDAIDSSNNSKNWDANDSSDN